MPLSPGTALQKGQYVIDALLESAQNGDLYRGTHVVSGMSVFIQVFPVSDTGCSPQIAALIERLQGISFSPQSPLPNPFQVFQENQIVCLALGKSTGLPWTATCQIRPAMSPKLALAAIRQVVAGVTWLREHEVAPIDLSPNRVWLARDSDRITLTGLLHASTTDGQEASDDSSQSVVKALSHLMCSFLLGDVLADEDADALITRLKQRLPNLSPAIVHAIRAGLATDASTQTVNNAEQWVALLRDSAIQYQTRLEPVRDRVPTPAPQRPPAKPAKFNLYPAVGVTALTAAIAGVTLGTVWRLNAVSLPGMVQLEPDQSFPAQTGWSADQPEVTFDEPFVPQQDDPIRREDWRDSDWQPAPQEEVWEPPVTYEEPPEFNEPLEDDWQPTEEATFSDSPMDFANDEPEPAPIDEEVPGEFNAPRDNLPSAPSPVPFPEEPSNFFIDDGPAVQSPSTTKSKSSSTPEFPSES